MYIGNQQGGLNGEVAAYDIVHAPYSASLMFAIIITSATLVEAYSTAAVHYKLGRSLTPSPHSQLFSHDIVGAACGKMCTCKKKSRPGMR